MTRRQEREPQPTPLLTLEQVATNAKEVLLQQGYHLPTLIVQGDQRTVVAQFDDFGETHDERAQNFFTAGMVLARDSQVGRLQQLFFIAEGWMSRTQDGQPPHQPPSQDPKRLEILIVTHHRPQGNQTRMMLAEMRRDTAGNLREVRDLAAEGDDDVRQADSPLIVAFMMGFMGGA